MFRAIAIKDYSGSFIEAGLKDKRVEILNEARIWEKLVQNNREKF